MSRGKGGQSNISSTIKKLKHMYAGLHFPKTKKELIAHARSGTSGDAAFAIASEFRRKEYEHYSDVEKELDSIQKKKEESL